MDVASRADSDTDTGGAEGSVVAVLNPHDLSVLETVPRDGRVELEVALGSACTLAARRAGRPAPHARIALLEQAAGLMAARAQDFALTVTDEGGKPIADTRAEVAEAIEALRHAAAILRTGNGAIEPIAPAPVSATRRVLFTCEPAGVVAVIADFDRPLEGVVRPLAAALAAGCPAIVRPAPETPLSCRAFVKLLFEAGLSPGRIAMLVTDDDALTEALCSDPRVAFVAYSGEPEAGWRLRAGLAPGVRCALELGGSPPVVVAGDADVYEVREALLGGCFANAGQSRNAVKRIFAHTKVATRFATQLAMKASGLLVGDPRHEETGVGPMIRPAAADRLHALVREAVDGGGQLLTGGERLTDTLYAPTVIFNPPQDCRLMTGPVRGPVVCVDPWFRVSEALERANAYAGGGPAAVFARSIETAMELADGLDASTVMVNDHTAFASPGLPASARGTAGLGGVGVRDLIGAMQAGKTVVLRTDPLFVPPDAEPG